MALKVPDVGELEMLAVLIADAANWSVQLYTNNHVPTDADTANNYTVAAFAGHAGQAPVLNAPQSQNGVATSTGNQLTFLCTADGNAEDIWGYYVTRNGVLLFAEKLSDQVPFATIQLQGDRVRITPKLTFKSEN